MPGAGKTEVYFEAIAAALASGRQVLVLLPEIALTAQWLKRFEDRFGAMPASWHSGLTSLERRETWRAIAEGRVGVVVGARSALFLPFANLGLIVVDEEHDGSFKQDDGVSYNARDMAVVRARLVSAPIVLASATPSLESVVNVTERPLRRAAPARSPWRPAARQVVGGRSQAPAAVARPLAVAAGGRGDEADLRAPGEQTLLFLNRRGYAPMTLCRACGHGIECPQCSAWLVEHRFRRTLICHHCGHAEPPARDCKYCGSVDQFVACGPGVERLAEEALELFPEARLELFTSDSLMNRDEATAAVERMIAGEIDILIGTQMAAKGHHFPNLTLVAVVDADLGLNGGDLRAAERTFQLLYQVAGRAGREDRPGRALVQTHVPEHPVMQALVSGDRDRFVAAELDDRRVAGMPPFGRLASLIISGPDPAAVDNVCAALARRAPHQDGVTILGPSTAPLALLRGRHRKRFLLKAVARYRSATSAADLAGEDRIARLSASADRRRSLFLHVTRRWLQRRTALKNRGNTEPWHPCALENRMVATRAFPGWSRFVHLRKVKGIQPLAGPPPRPGRGVRRVNFRHIRRCWALCQRSFRVGGQCPVA